MSGIVQRQAEQAAAAQESAQRRLDIRRAQREVGEIGIEQVEPVRGPVQQRAPLRLQRAARVETGDRRLGS